MVDDNVDREEGETMSLLRTVLTMTDEDPPDGALTSEPYATLDDGRAMWLIPVEVDYKAATKALIFWREVEAFPRRQAKGIVDAALGEADD